MTTFAFCRTFQVKIIVRMTELNRSYFYGDDTKYGIGWGNRTYFTFYSQFSREQYGIVTVEVFFLCLIFALALIVDTGLIYIVIRYRMLPNVTSYSVVNLTLAGIFFVIGVPFIINTRITRSWKLGSHVCRFLFYSELVAGSVIMWINCFISFDRYRSIVTPMKRPLSTCTAKLALILIWAINFLVYAPVAAFFRLREFPYGESNVTICVLLPPKLEPVRMSIIICIYMFIFIYCLPLTFLIHNYVRIILTLKNLRKKKLPGDAVIQNDSVSESVDTRKRLRIDRETKVVRFFISMLVLFICLYSPIQFAVLVIGVEGLTQATRMRSDIFLACICVAFSYSCVSPVLYGLFNEKIKLCLRKMWRKRRLTSSRVAILDRT